MSGNGIEQRRPDRVLVIGQTVVEIWQGDGLRTTLPDGRTIMAAPHDTDSYRQTARDHGYGADIFRLCAEHEVGHVLLADMLGLPESPVMRAVADGAAPSALTGHEEACVLAMQALCNATGVDLLALAERHVSRARLGDSA